MPNMKCARALALVLLVASLGLAASAQEEFRVVRLGEGAAILQLYTGTRLPTSVTVLASTRGLVVIDTGALPSRGAALRAAVERVFGRKDIVYVVNTHAHYDHTEGNQAFSDVPIVAHQNSAREQRRTYGTPEGLDALFRGLSRRRSALEAELKAAKPGSREEAQIRQELAKSQAVEGELRDGRLVLTLPAITFTDKMALELGDLTLSLSSFGQRETGDILVHSSQLRLLVVGDLFIKGWLPSFEGYTRDVPDWLGVLETLCRQGGCETVVCGHGDAMSADEFRSQIAYLRDIWEGVAAARREKATLAATKERLSFEGRYPSLATFTRSWAGRDLHASNVETAWRLQSESAARALESLIESRGLEAAVAEYKKSIAGNGRYALDENEMNVLGYRYLQGGKTAEASAVFEINAGAFPESWNAWDSLAESYLYSRDREKAEIHYAKSVALNPENQNGKDMLSELRGYKLDAAGETRTPARFPPGAGMGLTGPYLGQAPPGLQAKVFAPGIVSTSGNFEFALAFSPDGKELYFTRREGEGRNTIMVSRLTESGWTAPEEAAFAKGFPSSEPHVTPDGKKLYFGSRRPRPGVEGVEYGIWVVERASDGGWGEPRYHGPGMYVSVARGGNLYMTDVTNVIRRGAIVYPWAEGRYGPPKWLGGGVNAPKVADHMFVAPDEGLILLDSPNRPGGQGGDGDLWVCFRHPDGAWSDALNLGDGVNDAATQFCPTLSPDGKYIFYSTNRDIYWVSAAILDELRARALGPGAAGGGPPRRSP